MTVNPRSGGAPPADIAALITQELTALAVDAQTLATQLLPGDVVPAVVLSSNGLTDLLSINGLRVAAELPPSLLPGENIRVMVTGFDGERINLQIVPTPQADTKEAAGVPVRPAPSATAATPAPPASSTSAAASTNTAAPASAKSVAPASVAPATPSRLAFSATSPAPSLATSGGPAGKITASVNPARAVPNSAASASASGAVPAPPRPPASEYGPRAAPAPVPATPELKTIEARLVAAHATTVPTARPPASTGLPPGAKPVPRPAGQPPPAPASRPPMGIRQPPNASSPPTRPASPGPTVARSPFGAKPRLDIAHLPPVAPAMTRVPFGVRPPAAPVAANSPFPAASAAPRGPAAFAEPAVLLRALNLPVTSTNLALARMALESPEKVPNAFAVLERALAGDADPRVATLSTLASFVARIDPRSPVLAAQIAAFVDHVVTGREAKIAQLASAAAESAPPAPSKSGPNAEAGTEAPAAAAAGGRELQVPGSGARIAVVRAALDYDLKTQLLAVAADRAAGTDAATPKAAAFDRAVAGMLTAITALQLTAASTLNAHPDGFAFTVPLALPDGFANAHVRIDRDAPEGRKTPLDGDNFHIAFVLETRRLGTVAIDVMTVGRAVTLSVKTEAALAQRLFATALDRLSARLASLRYRVARADAAIAPPAGAEAASIRPASAPGAAPGAAQLVDVDA